MISLIFLPLVLIVIYQLFRIETILRGQKYSDYFKEVQSMKTLKPKRKDDNREVRSISSKVGTVTTKQGNISRTSSDLVDLQDVPAEEFLNAIDDMGRLKT